MMASLGGRTFVTLNMTGGGAGPAMTIEQITRPGVDGNAFLQTGRRGQQVTYDSLRDCASGNAVKTEFAAYLTLVGTRRTLVDSLGNSYTVVVMGVTRNQEAGVALFSGGSGGSHILRATWTLTVLS